MLRTLMSLTLGLAAGIGATAAYGQGSGGPGDSGQLCMVTQLRLRFATSNDDLRGGQDNLNIVVYFTGGAYQFAPNVNHSKNWPNNSVNMVEIPLNRPVPPGEIRALRLVHIADGGFNIGSYPELATPAAPIAIAKAFQSPDNWNMADVEVAVIGNGVGGRIATYGFHRFTGSNPDLIIGTHIPPNICSSGRPAANNGGQGEVTGGGSGALMSPGNEKGMVAAQQPSSPLLERNRVLNARTPGAGSKSGPGSTSGKEVTNTDILNMLRAGISEETILTTIRTRSATFDVSNQARTTFDKECAKIKHAGLTTAAWAAEVKNIWDSMTNVMIARETNGRGGEDENPTLSPITPRASSSASGSGSMKPLTNDDVVKMLQAGLPEQAILASIHSSSADFNLSNEAKTWFLKALRNPPTGTPVSAWRSELNGIWEAMVAKAAEGAGAPAATAGAGGISAGSKNADELSPQPYPPKSKSNSGPANTQTGKQFVPPPNLKVFTAGEARNPAALTLIRSVAQFKGTGGGNIGPEGTMSAPGNVSGGIPSSATASRPALAAPATTQPNSAPASPQQPRGGARPNSRLDTVAPNTTGLCLNNNAGIAAVNGQRFTQFTPGTQYVITGCGFGTTPGKVYLTGAFPAHNGKIDLGPSWAFGTQRNWTGHWSDQRIDAQLDVGLSGELDQYNVTLVVETSTGQQIQMGNVSFEAQRAEFMLSSIPSSALGFNPDPFGAADSPCTSSWVTSNCTVDVLRAIAVSGINPSPDTYTVQLKSGFVLSRVVLLIMSQSKVTQATAPSINGNQIVVNWNWTQVTANYKYSLYGLQIYVIGPLGVTNAWAGQ